MTIKPCFYCGYRATGEADMSLHFKDHITKGDKAALNAFLDWLNVSKIGNGDKLVIQISLKG